MTTLPRFVRACARRAQRRRLEFGGRASIDVTLADGSPWCLDLLDVSEIGVCFGLDPHAPVPVVGSSIDGAVLQVDHRTVRGRLRIVHVTEEFSSGTICGAEFAAETDTDREELAALIAELGARPVAVD